MKITDETYLYDPATGHAQRENPVPARGLKKRAEFTGKGADSARAADMSGIGIIDWEEVKRYSAADIEAFKDKYEIPSFLSQNAKTNKPRPTGNTGVIYGLALTPHYYPNLLNSMHDDKKGLLDFDKQEFNAFNGTNVQVAADSLGLPKSQMLTFCIGSSPACRTTCLVYAGQNPSTKQAPRSKMRLTWAFLSEPELFTAGLRAELKAVGRRLKKETKKRQNKLDLVVRLNMLSDLPWYRICPDLILDLAREDKAGEGRLAYMYDYTKVPFWNDEAYQAMNETAAKEGLISSDRYEDGQLVETVLDLTYSYSGANAGVCADALQHGVRIAAVFAPADSARPATIDYRTTWQEILAAERDNGKPFITYRQGEPHIALFDGVWPIVDGDESDYRMDDPPACIVALNFKQPNLRDRAELEREIDAVEARGRTKTKSYQKLLKSRASAVPGIAERVKVGREDFTKLTKVPDPTGRGFKYAQTMARLKRTVGQFSKGDFSGFSREEVLDMVEADDAVPMSMLMSLIEGTDVLIGPHVPVVLND